MTTLGDNFNLLSYYTGKLNNDYIVANSSSRAYYSGERSHTSGKYSAKKTIARGYGQYQRAYAAAKASTEMTLLQTIKG
jgi:hypothetical protein